MDKQRLASRVSRQHGGDDLQADPATGELLAKLPDLGSSYTKAAIESAHEAFKSFSTTSPQYRANILQEFYALTMANKEDLAVLITLENGKAFKDSLSEVIYGASYLQWNSGEALRMYGRTIPSSLPGTRNYTVLEVDILNGDELIPACRRGRSSMPVELSHRNDLSEGWAGPSCRSYSCNQVSS